jgi:iron-sulfur cluster repair protein YtfE (RIC family)
MLYFSNTGPDYINPSKDTRVADRGDLKDRIADHMMDGYKDRLKEFLDEQETQAKKIVQMNKDKELARKELEDMADEMFIKD